MTRSVLLHVFAAASLAGAFTDLARDFERAHPTVEVRLNFAGTPQLVAQIEQGARADVFASADERWMAYLARRGALRDSARVFARNALVLIAPRAGRPRVARLEDLAGRGVRLVIGAETVPVGRYTREVLTRLGREPGFGPGFLERARANVVSEEENVKAVVGRVQLGEADAGFCYRSDVAGAVAAKVRVIEIPEHLNVSGTDPVAVLARAGAPELGEAFVAYLLSPAGSRTLKRHGLTPVARAP